MSHINYNATLEALVLLMIDNDVCTTEEVKAAYATRCPEGRLLALCNARDFDIWAEFDKY